MDTRRSDWSCHSKQKIEEAQITFNRLTTEKWRAVAARDMDDQPQEDEPEAQGEHGQETYGDQGHYRDSNRLISPHLIKTNTDDNSDNNGLTRTPLSHFAINISISEIAANPQMQ